MCLELAELHGDAPAAVVALQRALVADPLSEPAHRALMRLYARTGRRQQALAQYQLLRQSLSAELAAEHLLRAWRADEPLDRDGLADAYASLWRTRRAACRAAARVVSSGRLSGLAMNLLRRQERVGRVALALMGKSDAGVGVW